MSHTVLVTGATGYIAKHLILQLLEAGHSVVGSVRNAARAGELSEALAPHLSDASVLERLRVVELDLSQDVGWDAAMQGVDVMMHTASPFPLSQPKDENEVIQPAVEGALRAVRAARRAGVTRVIMTSSSVAIMGGPLPDGRTAFDETDWTDPGAATATAYVKSKTLAERAVWDWQKDAPEMQITMINPAFVQGAPLDAKYGTSIQVVERLLKGTDPMLPNFGFPCVDVRDIALMHLRAMERDASIGQRVIGAERFIWFPQMAEMLKQDHPKRKIARRTAPNLVVRLLAVFDPSVRTILPVLGIRQELSAQRARDLLGMDFRDARDSLREAGDFLVRNDLV